MERFDEYGHLTDEALRALTENAPMDELSRLEVAEHLAFCDQCLQRYTLYLAAQPTLVPAHSCQESLWRRIRQRTIRLITSRYATAAAAVVLALTVLWGSARLPVSGQLLFSGQDAPISQHLTDWSQHWRSSINGLLSRCGDFFDPYHGPDSQAIQGGNS